MAVSTGVSNALERNWGMVDRAIDGLSDETLARQISEATIPSVAPVPMSRVVDVFMNARFQGKPEICRRELDARSWILTRRVESRCGIPQLNTGTPATYAECRTDNRISNVLLFTGLN